MSSIGVSLPFWVTALALIFAATAAVCLPLLGGRGLDGREPSGPMTADGASGGSTVAASRGGRLAAALAVTLPPAALVGYLWVGSPETVVQAAQAEAGRHHTAEDIDALIDSQTAQAVEHPQDALPWVTLGMTYAGLDRWGEAEEALAKAYALEPKDAFVISAYAEALAINSGRDLSGRPIELVREALQLAPQDEKALELAGIHAFQQQEYGQAAYYFRQLLKVLPPDSPYADDIRAAMRQAKALAEEAAFGPPLDTRPSADAERDSAPPVITGVIELDPTLADGLTGEEALFLLARPVSGGGAPVAALRTTVAQLPAAFTLDDSLAPLPDQTLSSHETLTLIARIARSGASEPMPGDLEGQIPSVRVGSQGVRLVIDRVRE